MPKVSLTTKSSEEFIWNTITGSVPHEKEFISEYQVRFSSREPNGRNWICKLKPGLIISFMDVMPMEDIHFKYTFIHLG